MQTAVETIHDYYNAFSTLDMRAIVSYYCEPSITIVPQNVLSAPTRAAVADALAPIVDGLRAKGYGRNEFVQPEITMFGERAAPVRGVAVRYTATGSELERIPLGYLLHRSEAGWKIAVLVVSQ